jgi:ABC-type polysaccharide/polyol phosphate export permease
MDGGRARPFDYLSRIWELRYFWFSLVRSDLSQRYSRSFLGIGWSLVRPLAMTAVFCVVFAQLFQIPFLEYAPFILLGLTLWQFLSETILGGCDSLSRAAPYIRQQRIPLAIFPLRTVLGTSFHALVALILAAAIAWTCQGFPGGLVLLSLIPSAIILFLLGWFLAIVGGVLHTHFYDTRHLLEIGLQILFYLTPVLYHPESLAQYRHLERVALWNPVTGVLEMFRQPILYGRWPLLAHYEASLALAAGAGIVAALALRKLERTLVFWI